MTSVRVARVEKARGAYLAVLTDSIFARSALKVPSALVSAERFWNGTAMPFLGVATGVADAMRARATVMRVALQNMMATNNCERTSWGLESSEKERRKGGSPGWPGQRAAALYSAVVRGRCRPCGLAEAKGEGWTVA